MSVPYTKPWAFLDDFRGKMFNGEWPTLPEMFRITVKRYPERPCFTIYEPDRISLNYTEALAKIEAVARYLHAKGIQKGDTLAVTAKNCPEWTVAYLGILFAGATVVPIDAQLHTAECDLLTKTARCKIMFCDEDKFEHYNNGGKAATGITEVISLKKGLGNYIYTIDAPELKGQEQSWTMPAEKDLAAILFTSGTTGDPKGVMLSHQNLVADCYLAQGTPLTVLHTDVFYALLPLHHAYTMLAVFIETISTGAEVVFAKRMIVSQILKDLKQAKITMLLSVPLLFNKLIANIIKGLKEKGPVVYGLISFLMGISGFIKKTFGVNPGKKMFGFILEKASLTTLRIGICGGGPLAPSVFKKFNELGIDFVQGYGLTETSPIINLNPVEAYKETSVGRCCPGVDMKVIDAVEDGRGNMIGEIVLKGPQVMMGYFEKPEETAAVFTPDGYFKTGDLGYLDNENYLYLTGRAKNVVVTNGGKNVYPEEIENEFQLFGEIDQVLVRGFLADAGTKAEQIECLVYPAEDFAKGKDAAAIKARTDEIVAEVNQRLLPYQRIARSIILDKPMEMTTTKKIKRSSV
ncbi:MAG: AMP-binding protein [Spirochaetaceae bacterium]|jgi:long-chain acyl-CoA synthetase|nr:AMP-binding protein [Spirochaetaceae bacterium]